jgi:hypothetical protein
MRDWHTDERPMSLGMKLEAALVGLATVGGFVTAVVSVVRWLAG